MLGGYYQMLINPEDYKVSVEEIRRRLQLKESDIVYEDGYEYVFNKPRRSDLQKQYDLTSLFVRLRDDYVVIKNKISFILEAKKNMDKYIESTQLLLNKQLTEIGIKIFYSFPEYTIIATDIPLKLIAIPPRYKNEFCLNLRSFFEKFHNNIQYNFMTWNPEGRSGDPFTPINHEKLKKISQLTIINFDPEFIKSLPIQRKLFS